MLLIVAASCKKDKQDHEDLMGTWELRYAGGSWNPQTFAAGNGSLLKFTKSGYELIKDGVVIRSGSYETKTNGVATGSECSADGPANPGKILIFADSTVPKQAYKFNDNQLEISYGCFAVDAGRILKYTKIAN